MRRITSERWPCDSKDFGTHSAGAAIDHWSIAPRPLLLRRWPVKIEPCLDAVDIDFNGRKGAFLAQNVPAQAVNVLAQAEHNGFQFAHGGIGAVGARPQITKVFKHDFVRIIHHRNIIPQHRRKRNSPRVRVEDRCLRYKEEQGGSRPPARVSEDVIMYLMKNRIAVPNVNGRICVLEPTIRKQGGSAARATKRNDPTIGRLRCSYSRNPPRCDSPPEAPNPRV